MYVNISFKYYIFFALKSNSFIFFTFLKKYDKIISVNKNFINIEYMETNLNQHNIRDNQEKIFEFFSLFREYLKIIKYEEIKILEEKFKNKIIAWELEELVEKRDNDIIIIKNDLLKDLIENEKSGISKIIANKIFKYFLKIKWNNEKLSETINEFKKALDEKNENPEKFKYFLTFCEIEESILSIKKDIENILLVA